MNLINRLTSICWMNAALVAVTCLLSVAAMAESQMTPQMRSQAKKVFQACKADIKQYCKEVQPGDGRIAACLRTNQENLAPVCQAALAEVLPK